MQTAKLITALALSAVILGAVMPSMVLAENSQNQNVDGNTVEQTQELNQKMELECETGGYGQRTCRASGSQQARQEQRVRIAGATTDKIHYVANTGLDLYTGLATAALMLGGVGATALKVRMTA